MYAAIVFLPLLGSAIAGLFGRLIGARPSELVTTVLLFASMVLSWIACRHGKRPTKRVSVTSVSRGGHRQSGKSCCW